MFASLCEDDGVTPPVLALQVWTFSLNKVEFKLNQAGNGSMSSAQNMSCESTKVVVVDAKLGEQ